MQNKFTILLACFAMFGFSRVTYGALGDVESSVDKDAQSLKFMHKKSQGTGYTVHELTGSTVNVKEYVSTAGVVFAVTWRGARQPDLSTLLGSYSADFNQADMKIKKGGGRRTFTVKTSKIVVTRGGHMRDLHGKAIAPALVPAGVDAETLP